MPSTFPGIHTHSNYLRVLRCNFCVCISPWNLAEEIVTSPVEYWAILSAAWQKCTYKEEGWT